MGQVEDLLKGIQRQIEAGVDAKCAGIADRICDDAIRFRQTAPGKHNFTGNLINSIVAVVYRDRSPRYARYAAQLVGKPAIQCKMTAYPGEKPRRYRFELDWDGAKSQYDAEVVTDEGYGKDDAEAFVNGYRPSAQGWVITVAYPVEYAPYIERERQTTGIMALEREWTAAAGQLRDWIVKDTPLPPSSLFGSFTGGIEAAPF